MYALTFGFADLYTFKKKLFIVRHIDTHTTCHWMIDGIDAGYANDDKVVQGTRPLKACQNFPATN